MDIDGPVSLPGRETLKLSTFLPNIPSGALFNCRFRPGEQSNVLELVVITIAWDLFLWSE